MRTNCIIFAYVLKWRRKKTGATGYIVRRKSRWGWFPHILYGEKRENGQLRLVSYKPVSPFKRKIPPLFFEGRVEWGDTYVRSTDDLDNQG